MSVIPYRRKQKVSAVNTQIGNKLEMKIDLHSHTHFSDGHLSPKELVDRAHNMQVDVLAVTDHDTVDSIAPVVEYQASQKRALKIIPGVEISTSWHNFDIHILGLNLDYQDPTLLERLAQQSERRELRARKIDEKLQKAGVSGTLALARKFAGVGQITRAHFARAMVTNGVVSDLDAAFRKYLGKGKKAHVKPQWIDIAEAVTWIHDAGGKAVLAHPGHYDMTAKWLRRLLNDFVSAGGDGMEVTHSHLSPDKRQLLTELAVEHNLDGSVGSDFHYPNRWTELGRNLNIPDILRPIWHDWSLGVA